MNNYQCETFAEITRQKLIPPSGFEAVECSGSRCVSEQADVNVCPAQSRRLTERSKCCTFTHFCDLWISLLLFVDKGLVCVESSSIWNRSPSDADCKMWKCPKNVLNLRKKSLFKNTFIWKKLTCF